MDRVKETHSSLSQPGTEMVLTYLVSSIPTGNHQQLLQKVGPQQFQGVMACEKGMKYQPARDDRGETILSGKGSWKLGRERGSEGHPVGRGHHSRLWE